MIRYFVVILSIEAGIWAYDAAAVIVVDEYGTRTPACRSPQAVHYAAESHTLKCLPNQEMNPEGYDQ